MLDNNVVKKTLYDNSFTKVYSTDTSVLVLKNQYSTDKSSRKKKIDNALQEIPDTDGVDKKQIIMQILLRSNKENKL